MDRYPTVELQLLGGFWLKRAGAAVPVQRSGQRLLALLALRGPCLRSYAAGVLWGDRAEGRALACLRTTIWRLGQRGLQVSTADAAELVEPPGLRIDIRDLPAVVTRWRDAGPIRDDLLPGWYDDWVIMERERLRHALLATVEARAVDDLDPAARLAWALLAVRADPLRESAHRLVLQAHLARGNVAAARRHYDGVRAVFQAEFGVAPSQALEELASGRSLPLPVDR